MIHEQNLWLFFGTCLAVFAITYAATRDVFHPNCLAMLFFAGTVGSGAVIVNSQYLPTEFALLDYNHDLLLYAMGVWCFGLGSLWGGTRTTRIRSVAQQLEHGSLIRISYILGAIALATYAAQVLAGGGFTAVYSTIKGRGDLGSGVQDLIFLAVPAGAAYIVAMRRRYLGWRNILVLAVLLSPLLIPGFLSTRRGYAAMAMGTIFFSWYFAGNKRPSVLYLLLASMVGGATLLILVSLREEIYLGSDILERISVDMVTTRMAELFVKPGGGSEFIYSSLVIRDALEQGDFWWGARYVAVVLLWPIPSFVFANKYATFGLDGMLYNAGTTGQNFQDELGTLGAAPMLIGDTFVEFSYGCLLFLFILGFWLSRLWRGALRQSDVAIIIYVCALTLMVFLFSQTFAAFIQRFVLMAGLTWLVSHYERRSLGSPRLPVAMRVPRHRIG